MNVEASIRDLRHRMLRLERSSEREQDHLDAPTSAFTAVLYAFGGQLVGGIILFSSIPKNGAIWDYLAYVLPCVAGAAAGFGLFKRKWVIHSFVFSVLILWGAFICYLMSKEVTGSYIQITGGIEGMAIATFLVIKRTVEHERNPGQELDPEIYVFIALFFISTFLFFVGALVFFDDKMAAEGRWHPSFSSQSSSFKTATSIPRHVKVIQKIRKGGKCSPPLLWRSDCEAENFLLMTQSLPSLGERK